MSERLHDRWLEFVQAVQEVCWAHNQNPEGGVLEANESILKVSLPSSGGERQSKEFSEQEILTGDLRALASEFYAGYTAADDRA